MTITKTTRRGIFDFLVVGETEWAGREEESVFLGRIFNLKDLPSNDPRCKNAEEDISLHRDHFDDWPDDWVLHDDRFDLMSVADDLFLQFLCATVHPSVRSNQEEVSKLVKSYNGYLKADGWEITETSQISGHSIFSAGPCSTGVDNHLSVAEEAILQKLNSTYVNKQILRIRAAEKGDPELAIGTAKEFVETVCKSILEEREVAISPTHKFHELVRLTAKELKLTPDDIHSESSASKTIRVLLQNMAAIADRLSELRRLYGTGHGKSAKTTGLETRHARLATGAAITLAVFLFETHKERSGE